MKLHAPFLILAAAAALPACGDDGGGDDEITWRVPCQSHGHWGDGMVDTTTYTYDARKHPTAIQTVLADGTVDHTVADVWQGDLLQSIDYVGFLDYRGQFTYDGDLVTSYTRTDRKLDGGDDGFTLRYTYDGDDLVSFVLDMTDPLRGDTTTTITGNHATREVDVQCPVAAPTECDTYVWEQPDRDPDHWTKGTIDFGSDGTIDYQWERTLDDHGLDLSYVETSFSDGAAGVMAYRTVTTREADGTELGYTYDIFNSDGTISDSYVLADDFRCGAARIAPRTNGTNGTIRAAVDARAAAQARLPRWRVHAQ